MRRLVPTLIRAAVSETTKKSPDRATEGSPFQPHWLDLVWSRNPMVEHDSQGGSSGG